MLRDSGGRRWERGSAIRKASRVFLPQSRPVEIMLMRSTKTHAEWNGAGTFGFLVTLNKHERL